MIFHKPFRKRKVLFIHIPKTAGTTFKSILYRHFKEKEICPVWDEEILKEDLAGNIKKYRLFHGHFNYELIPAFDEKPVLLTFLREPIARIRSHYYYEKSLPEVQANDLPIGAREVVYLAKNKDIETYLNHDSEVLKHMTTNLQTRKIAASSNYPLDQWSDDEWYEMASSHLQQFDFVGILERFDESMQLFNAKFGIKDSDYEVKNNITPIDQKIDIESMRQIKGLAPKINLDDKLYRLGCERFEKELISYGIKNNANS